MPFREGGPLLDARKFALQRRGSLFIAEAMDVHRSHLAGTIHTRFEEFDRRCEGWHALRALVLGTNMMSADDERVFDVLFFFGPMPPDRARAWSRVDALPRWAAPWVERGGFVSIEPLLIPKMSGRRLCVRPAPDDVRRALDALDNELHRRELVRQDGALLEFATSQWLSALRATLEGRPEQRRYLHWVKPSQADEIERLIGGSKGHADVAAWIKLMSVRRKVWKHWTPLGKWTVLETIDRLVTSRVTDEVFCRLKGLRSPRQRIEELTQSQPRGRSRRASTRVPPDR